MGHYSHLCHLPFRCVSCASLKRPVRMAGVTGLGRATRSPRPCNLWGIHTCYLAPPGLAAIIIVVTGERSRGKLGTCVVPSLPPKGPRKTASCSSVGPHFPRLLCACVHRRQGGDCEHRRFNRQNMIARRPLRVLRSIASQAESPFATPCETLVGRSFSPPKSDLQGYFLRHLFGNAIRQPSGNAATELSEWDEPATILAAVPHIRSPENRTETVSGSSHGTVGARPEWSARHSSVDSR